ncbi:MAG: M81 family metallopeptidase [Xanthomonadales bacterium]|jgi:microcystin degradation protein MlrC|nr:M81 family metallopeptidase [Xanthomonadales bacterium]
MKIFAAYFAHETNSFSPVPTNMESFSELGIYRTSENASPTPTALKGAWHFYEEAQRRGDTIQVGLCAHAQPSSPCLRADYETLRGWLLEDLARSAEALDAVLLFMHGSMLAEGIDDCEGDVLEHIRDIVGTEIPIGLLLDLHCNVTDTMLQHATVIKACKEYPHTDFRERAIELYDLCVRIREGVVNPSIALARVPMFGLFQTANPPMRPFIDSLIDLEKMPAVLSISLGHGFPWSDFPGAGASVLVTTDNDPELADSLARETSRKFFNLRTSGQTPLSGIDDALDQALSFSKGTVVIADMSDNPGGGAASDSTFILQRMLDRGIRDAAVAYMWDPEAVSLAFAAGEGARLRLNIGGKVGPNSGEPVELEVEIIHLRRDAIQAHIADGTPTRLGRTAVVSANGIEIALNDIRQQPFTPEGLVNCGIDPWSRKVLVLKSSHHFYEGFHGRAAKIIYCDAPGMLNSDIQHLPYRRVRRPIWPLDHDETELLGEVCVKHAGNP